VFGIAPQTIGTFLVILASQLIGVALLPKTQGYTHVGYSLAQLSMFAISFAAMARLVRSGVDLGILIPLLSTAMPLASVGIGIVAYGESASPGRVALLAAACVLVGFASKH
jgi:multidrug transporter EmrE-like cation transporter